MKRIIPIALVCGFLVFLIYYAGTHENLDRVEHMQAELARLDAQNQKLREDNQKLEATLIALRDDPRLAERRARASGMARPNEIVFQFEQPDTPMTLQAWLKVAPDSFELAGKQVALQELSLALDTLKEQLPGATLKVSFHEDVDPIQRQHVIDSVEASTFQTAEFNEATR